MQAPNSCHSEEEKLRWSLVEGGEEAGRVGVGQGVGTQRMSFSLPDYRYSGLVEQIHQCGEGRNTNEVFLA